MWKGIAKMFLFRNLRNVLAAAAFATAVFMFSSGAAAQEVQSYDIMDAKERGTFDIGPGIGGAYVAADKDLNKDVLEFEYQASLGAYVGVWTKKYPPELAAGVADAVKIGIKVPKPQQLREISIKLEFKGSKASQDMPLRLKNGWNFFHESINWSTIGELTEVTFVVSPIVETEKPVEGILYFDLEFYPLSFLNRYATWIKIGLVLLMSFLGALLFALLRKFRGSAGAAGTAVPAVQLTAWRRVRQDFLYGCSAILILWGAFYVYFAGTANAIQSSRDFKVLSIGLIGLILADLLKWTITGKRLNASEAFQNVFLAGLVGVSSSAMAVFKVPTSWTELVMLNKVMAALAFLVYQVWNIRSLACRGKHVKPLTGGMIIGAPYVLNILMMCGDPAPVMALINAVTGGVMPAGSLVLLTLSRMLIVLVFNEIVTNAISLATRGAPVKTAQAHLTMILVSAGVIAAPLFADLGSTAQVGTLPSTVRALAVMLATMLAFGGLWGEVYLITGMFLDFGKRLAPSGESIASHVNTGVKKGFAYSAILVGLLYFIHILISTPFSLRIMGSVPLLVGMLAGSLVFPLLKTIMESFDGSLPFFGRLAYSYRDPSLYARGIVAGFGFAFALTHELIQQAMSDRILFGAMTGLVASSGISLARDAILSSRKQGRIQSWKMYLVDGLLGSFVGGALAFYLDARQVPVIIDKFKQYTSAGFSGKEYITYPLVNKWGKIDLGNYSGGARLLFTESLAGVINWAIAAWLFAINKVFLQALFEKHTAPVKFFFSQQGFAQLIEHMIFVLRWGLWMSPIIFTFLRMMPDPTWYNQDGAIRTMFAAYKSATLSGDAFREWSLNTFVYIIAFDIFRVLIWMDHMGLRVATLVNLSFIGLDRLDERVARFIGPAAAQRYIPEAVKRFTTWAPLLIPFYLPRGEEWDYAWNKSQALENAARSAGGQMVSTWNAFPWFEKLFFVILAVLIFSGVSFILRASRRRLLRRRVAAHQLGNRSYRVYAKENGEIYSEVDHYKRNVYPGQYDITRRSYDFMDPCGRILFLVDMDEDASVNGRAWPVAGNFPQTRFAPSQIRKGDDCLKIENTANGVRTAVDIVLPDYEKAVEVWTVTVENLTDRPRRLKLVPYLEWVLNGGLHDRFHTQYGRLFCQMEYAGASNTILAWQRSTKAMGILSSDTAPEGFLTSRIDFIGRAQSIWRPRVFETLNFLEARDTAAYPTFDPIASLLLNADVGPKTSRKIRIMIGYAKNRKDALELASKHLKPRPAAPEKPVSARERALLIGHGEILPGTAQPYCEYADQGNKLLVHTPFTPRPFDHAMSNPLHSVMVTNRGLHTSCNGNSQQNRLTPDWPDMVTREVPSEAIYLYDPEDNEWYSPTYHPLNQGDARYASEFSVDGTAVFRMNRSKISTELVVFVPPQDPLGVYLLTVRNASDRPKTLRIAPYFQMVLEFQPERSGTLRVRRDKETDALYFENPRNIFRSGWAFASMSAPSQRMETLRGRFYGTGRGPDRPYLVESGGPDAAQRTDNRQIAAMLGSLDVPARGERTVAIILGQTDQRKDAVRLVKKYKDLKIVREALEDTRSWWRSLMQTAGFKTNQPAFDHLQNWLKYQALAERIWARRGFYQTSGAYGFRDQLQDAVNLMWVDPALARKQILLHASQQFPEGDVFHWFFTQPDGRTAFSCRSHASDNPVWLAWAVAEYVRATGDMSILDEQTTYVWSEFPFADLPRNKDGWGHLYHRSTRADSVYAHCLRAIDLILERRTGKHGLPHIRTGDWNDGLDEIGSHGRGESVWLGFFLYTILKGMLPIIEARETAQRKEHYASKLKALGEALDSTWREDRYLRAFHDDGTEIGVKNSGIWEIDALTAAWAVMADINFERSVAGFDTALRILEKDKVVLLGWPALREDSKPYLGRSSKYPEGVRENGMYCHGVQWLIRAARILSERFDEKGDSAKADEYRQIAFRLWSKIAPVTHAVDQEIEVYGGQPNKQPADLLTTFEAGRMIWNGYTGAAGWMLRQAFEGVIGATLSSNEVLLPDDLHKPRGTLKVTEVFRDLGASPLRGGSASRLFDAQNTPVREMAAAIKNNS